LDEVLTPESYEIAMTTLVEGLTSENDGKSELTTSRTIELEHFCKDGSTVWTEVTSTFLRDPEGKPLEILGITRDITSRRRRLERLQAMSLVDELTGLYNRRGFFALAQQQLKVAYRTYRGMAVLFIDFDNLKEINDTWGHQEGNTALIETANVLKESFRESDIIARIGGDEFAIMALEVPMDSVEILIGRMKEKIGLRNATTDKRFDIAVSVGVTRFNPRFPCTIDDLLMEADKLMYEEKRRKKEFKQAHPSAAVESQKGE
jgi:diguanylate cyclase (GGDEF)-like protein